MRLLPASLEQQTGWEDGLWEEHPGYPWYEGSWIHPPAAGQSLPEFEFEEGHDHNKNKSAPVLVIGAGNDTHIRQPDERIPRRLCQLVKIGRNWWLEAILVSHPVYFGDRALTAGERVQLKDRDTFSLLRPPTPLTYRILVEDEDNWYIDIGSHKDYPNKHRSMFPFRAAFAEECPDELKRLAWQTDQMRRRSEEDQVRVADWAAFAQYVKRHYLRYGIECKPWIDAKRPHDEKPPSFPPRPYPAWVSEVVAKERQLPGISADRPMAFQSSMELSGVAMAEQLDYRGEPPKLEELYANPVASGPAQARSLGKGGAPHEDASAAWDGDVSVATAVGGVGATLSGAVGGRGKGRGKGKGEMREAARRAKQDEAKKMNFMQWLEGMDESRFLLQYHDQIAENFDSLEQIIDIYFKNGEIQKAFFDDAGIKKLGHRRIFEKWFQDTFGNK